MRPVDSRAVVAADRVADRLGNDPGAFAVFDPSRRALWSQDIHQPNANDTLFTRWRKWGARAMDVLAYEIDREGYMRELGETLSQRGMTARIGHVTVFATDRAEEFLGHRIIAGVANAGGVADMFEALNEQITEFAKRVSDPPHIKGYRVAARSIYSSQRTTDEQEAGGVA